MEVFLNINYYQYYVTLYQQQAVINHNNYAT